MLDGILGRGFTVKCKPLIKTTRTRIEVVRKRAEAKQRFLKEDLGKLLANGLDINAYGRTEEYIAGKNLLSCYDFLDQSCEYILKQLSRMQKLEECPEECKEVIASLMYAAARFSDLPELRDLRDTFKERYGKDFEVFVNQKFVEKLSSKSPPSEKRVRVLQDVASEFSIKWDAKGFQKRMASPSVVAQAEVHKTDKVKQRYGLPDEKSSARRHGEGNAGRRDDANHHATGTKGVNDHIEKSLSTEGGISLQGEYDSLYHARQFPTENSKHSYPVEKVDRELKAEKPSRSSHGKLLDKADPGLKAEKSSRSAHGKLLDNGYARDTTLSNGVHDSKKGENMDALFYERAKFGSGYGERQGKSENAIPAYDHSNQDKTKDIVKKDQEERGSARLKSLSDYPLPPPYVKSKDKAARPPYVKPKEDKHRHNEDSVYAGSDPNKNFLDPAASGNRSNKVNNSSRLNNEHEHDRGERSAAHAKAQSYGHENDLDYRDEQIPLPKPRSLRRKHHKSSSAYDAGDSPDDVGIAKISSSSRRKDHSRRGLQVLFDEDHHRKDDEEKMIDKLLLHYSKKPSNYDTGKLRKKVPAQQPSSHKIPEAGESSMDRSSDRSGKKHEAGPPTRSVSLPPAETSASPVEPNKVYNRATSFQGDNQVRHVHPKLPDYDDLAARFAALKGR